MQQTSNTGGTSGGQEPRHGARPVVVVLTVVVLGAAVWLAVRSWMPRPSGGPPGAQAPAVARTPAPAATEPAATEPAAPAPAPATAGEMPRALPPASVPTLPPAVSPGAASVASVPELPAVDPQSRALIGALTAVNAQATPAGEEALAEWTAGFRNLAQQGAASVPAIHEFLRSKADVTLGTNGWQTLGFRSGREAMIEALRQIGGAEALAVSRETLQQTEAPRELALLARSLEAQAPETYRAEILAAARAALVRAGQADQSMADVGPVFEVFERFGGPEVVGDLEQAMDNWRYYAAHTLGQLADGAGVPALVRMANESTTPSTPVLDTLAGLSTQHPAAREALIEQVRAQRIPPATWPALVQALAGDQMQMGDSIYDPVIRQITGEEYSTTHIGAGNQNYLRAPTVDSLTADSIARQTALIDELQAAAGDNAAAVQALDQARAVLARRLARLPPPGAGTPPGQ